MARAAHPAELLRRAAGHGVGPSAPPLALGDPDRWAELLGLAERERVLGLLVAATEDGAVEVDAAHRAELLETHERWCVHAMRLERELLRAAACLDAAGVPALTMKGPALAHLIYADPSHRVFADLDLLVPSDRLREAVVALERGLGAEPVLPELRPGFDERFGKESLLRTAPTAATPGGLELDVHRTLVGGALGQTIPVGELFTDTRILHLGGHAVPTLGPVPALLLSCYQASIADVPPRLAACRDVAELVLAGDADVDAVVETAERWQARAVVADAVTRSWRILAPTRRTPLVDWADSYPPTVRERLLLAAHRAPGHVYWRQIAAVAVLPGIEERLSYLRAVVLPQQSYLRRRQWSTSQHARRAWRSLSRPVREPAVGMARRVRRRLAPPR